MAVAMGVSASMPGVSKPWPQKRTRRHKDGALFSWGIVSLCGAFFSVVRAPRSLRLRVRNRLPVAGGRLGRSDGRERIDARSVQSMATKRPQQAQAGEPFSWVFVPRRGESFRLSPPGPWCPRAGRFSPRVRVSADNGLYSRAASPHNRRFQPTPTPMGNLKKKRRLKMAKHKRRKRLKANRHKKRTWQK